MGWFASMPRTTVRNGAEMAAGSPKVSTIRLIREFCSCAKGKYKNFIGGSAMKKYRLVFVRATTPTHGPLLSFNRKRLPIGSCLGQYAEANSWFTTATRRAPAL